MKKFFLIPLLTMLCTVMAWAATVQVGDFTALKNAIDNASNGDVIELTADISYPDGWATYTGKKPNSSTNEDLYTANPTLTGLTPALCIKKSITLDGKNHRIDGFGKYNINADASTNNHRVTLAVRPDNVSDAIDVTIKNISMGNTAKNFRYYGIITFDGVAKLTCENVNITCSNFSYQEPLCFTGAATTALNVVIKDSKINAGKSSYPAYILKPITATINNSTFVGYCALYFKYRATGVYGSVAGSRGSVVNAENCDFNAPNVHSGYSNDFAVFPCEDDNITLNLHNCGMNAQELGNAGQDMVCASEYATRREYDININISGDNSHINGRFAAYNWSFKYATASGNSDSEVYENGYWQKWNSTKKEYDKTGYDAGLAFTPATGKININVTGGTFSLNPETYKFGGHVTSAEDISAFAQEGLTIPATHKVQTVNQSGVTVYRVVKKADGTAINDNAGQNEDKTIEVATGGGVALANETTEAGYVQVKNEGANATHVTVAKNNVDPEHSQTLIVNNGLDVLGTSTVTVQPTAALVVGEGGITTQSATNIVIEADEDGSASLLLHPAITVNQTPELTVKMKAHVGKISTNNYEWHRFAIPVDEISTLPSTAPTSTTAIFTWDHAAQGGQGDWVSISALSDLDPFKGYTLTVDYDGVTDYVYTFTGHLTGNINTDLQLTHQGYNFFGNSYTGYIKLATLANAIIGNADLDATVWAWDSEHQVYGSVSLRALQEAEDGNFAHLIFPAWKREIAPMQTFILRLPNTDNATAEVDYASAIWGNPRYSGSTSSAAPARMAEIDGSIISMSISSENGSADNVLFMEKNAYSDDFENGYDAMKYMNENAVNMFVTVNGEDLSAVATDAIEGKMLTIQTGKAVNYTLTIDAALGAEYAIRDNVTNQVIAIEEGATYEFAAQPNSTIAGRFEIVGRAQMPTAIENTEVKANVKGIYTIMGQYLGEDFDILPAGVYVVNGVKIVK